RLLTHEGDLLPSEVGQGLDALADDDAVRPVRGRQLQNDPGPDAGVARVEVAVDDAHGRVDLAPDVLRPGPLDAPDVLHPQVQVVAEFHFGGDDQRRIPGVVPQAHREFVRVMRGPGDWPRAG